MNELCGAMGFWLEELATPYYVFKAAGVDITLASSGRYAGLAPSRANASIKG